MVALILAASASPMGLRDWVYWATEGKSMKGCERAASSRNGIHRSKIIGIYLSIDAEPTQDTPTLGGTMQQWGLRKHQNGVTVLFTGCAAFEDRVDINCSMDSGYKSIGSDRWL
jgi:hypothetical protein